jgi:glycine/serine hydroxymethyltransferase
VKTSMGNALKTEFEAYSSILNNLRALAQELKARDPNECQVTETIRTHLLQTLDSLMSGPEEMHSGWA